MTACCKKHLFLNWSFHEQPFFGSGDATPGQITRNWVEAGLHATICSPTVSERESSYHSRSDIVGPTWSRQTAACKHLKMSGQVNLIISGGLGPPKKIFRRNEKLGFHHTTEARFFKHGSYSFGQYRGEQLFSCNFATEAGLAWKLFY